MRRALRAAVLLLTGGALIRIVLADQYVRYVRDTMAVPLLVAGGAVAVLGFAGWWSATARSPQDPRDPAPPAGEHDHGGAPAVAWLLLVPVLAILLVPPPALGSDAVLRRAGVSVPQARDGYGPLPDGDPLALTPKDAVDRVVNDPDSGIIERRVAVVGFVVPDPGDGSGWSVARITLACCAADGIAYRIRVSGVPAPAADSWVSVVGHLQPPDPTAGDGIPRLVADSAGPYQAPVNPYG